MLTSAHRTIGVHTAFSQIHNWPGGQRGGKTGANAPE